MQEFFVKRTGFIIEGDLFTDTTLCLNDENAALRGLSDIDPIT